MSEPEPSSKTTPKRTPRWKAWPWLVLAFLTVAYGVNSDGFAALTIFPAFTWLPLVLIPGVLRAFRKRPALLIAGLLFALVFCEELSSLKRPTGNPIKTPGYLRVVCLNCAGGSPLAAAEVAALSPDIVLLQESPGPRDVEKLAKMLYGPQATWVKGPDASILTHLPEVKGSKASQINATDVQLNIRGLLVRVTSLRLQPPAFRVDLFSPDCWKTLTDNRQARRREIRELFANRSEEPAILGGDFNCQSGDRSLDAMPNWLRDAFYEGGTGWGHTAVNDYPLARIDKVWVTKEFRVVRQFVQRTVNSDHRMVITDLASN